MGEVSIGAKHALRCLDWHVELFRTFGLELAEDVASARSMIIECSGRGGTVFWAGNGGSAAMASHMAAEMVGLGHRSFALTDASVLTALANDHGYWKSFRRQVTANVRAGDVLVLLSTSGTSQNIVEAALEATGVGAATIGITGADNEGLADAVNVAVCVPSDSTQLIQEAHLFIGHYITGMYG